MKYLINQTVCFDCSTGMLCLPGDINTSVQLSRPGTLLLTELVRRPGITHPRDELLITVWQNNGMTPSGNNLSNHISYLRKSFRQLGITDEIVITVPGEGFYLKNAHPQPAPTSGTLTGIVNQTEGAEHDAPSGSPERPFRHAVVNFGFPLVLLVLAMMLFSAAPPALNTADLPAHFSLGSCLMTPLGARGTLPARETLSRLQAFLKQKSIDCAQEKSTVYFAFLHAPAEKAGGERTLFLAQCTRDRHGEQHCENYLSARSGAQ